MNKKFYITTTLPYVNSDPHIGFAMELVRADVIARAKALAGYDVFFNTGTDEHGQKLYDAAKKEGREVQDYVDEYAEKFKGLKDLLSISPDVHFIRTTDEHHVKAAQEFWKLVSNNGYIYKKAYQSKYCVGCELNKTDSELDENGQCLIHPHLTIELIDEENYFFKFSLFQDKLLDFYKKNPAFVVPEFRYHEIRSFVERGLEDFSISRLKSKMSWGVPVPGDDDHVMYVWFDALVNYISTLGWPENTSQFEDFWKNGTPTQYCGKDNLRQQSAMWQAMLMAADLPNSHQIVINGFINGEGGVKMSKSLGNVVNPYDVVAEYGTDALRYFLLRELSSFEDSPFTMERFKDAYNSGLANGLGNLVSRLMTLSEKYLEKRVVELIVEDAYSRGLNKFITNELDSFNLKLACDLIWIGISKIDKQISDQEVFKLIKVDEIKGKKILIDYIYKLSTIACELEIFIPETSKKIKEIIIANKKPDTPLFMRKD